MEYRHEIIDFGESVPVKCFIHQLGHSAQHWHNSLELLFVLSGSVSIVTSGRHYRLHKDDVILINSNDPHELTADSCILAAVQIKLSLFDDKLVRNTSLRFDCNSLTRPNDPGIPRIKRIVAQFVKNYAMSDESRLFRAKSLSYALLAELVTSFHAENSNNDSRQMQYQYERIARIVSYINQHLSENITLQTLAEQEYLSVPYLSKFFVRMMGMNFSVYLNQLRLERAVSDLLSTSDTIDEISQRSGFANPQSFVQLFKKKYGLLPSKYRKQQAARDLPFPKSTPEFNEYTILDTHQYLNYFASYLNEAQASPLPEEHAADLSTQATVSVQAGKLLRHKWKRFIGVGSAKELLMAGVREMLSALQKDVGFEYVKFHGILSDDMRVVSRSREGSLSYSFVYVDKALDFLRSIGLKPLVQLSFMPGAIAKDRTHTIFESTMINSLPENMQDWCDLIRAFMRHILSRYGREEISSWLYTVWNEPDTPRNMFGFGEDAQFYSFYKESCEAVRSVLPEARIGSPSTYFDAQDGGRWIRCFSKWCSENGCMPDFLLFHYYGTKVTLDQMASSGQTLGMGQLSLTDDADDPSKTIDLMLEYARDAYPENTPVYLSEWNFTPSKRDLLGDTCFRACYLVKNILENYDRLDAMGYWMLTDMFEEHQIPDDVFHGGLGLYTYNGIPKSACHAFRLLAMLGDELIEKGDGWFLTRKGNTYQLMLYNYSHYSALYAAGEPFDMTYKNRYTPFEPLQKRDFELRLQDIGDGEWQIKEYTLNRQSGSSFDKWVDMGAMPMESSEEVELLKGYSMPMLNRYSLSSNGKSLTINALLEPLEVRLMLFCRSQNT